MEICIWINRSIDKGGNDTICTVSRALIPTSKFGDGSRAWSSTMFWYLNAVYLAWIFCWMTYSPFLVSPACPLPFLPTTRPAPLPSLPSSLLSQLFVLSALQWIAVVIVHLLILWLQESIGEGSFGRVYKGRRKNTAQIIALKVNPLQVASSHLHCVCRYEW